VREHRRQTYQRKEALLRRTIIISAWERWWKTFMEKLQPLSSCKIRGIWFLAFFSSGCPRQVLDNVVTAVQFNSKRIKEKIFKRWRNAMPKALRERKARETDRHNTLARHFEVWIKTYQAKTIRKAVRVQKISDCRPPHLDSTWHLAQHSQVLFFYYHGEVR